MNFAAPLVLATSMHYARYKDDAVIAATRIPTALGRQGEMLQGWAIGNIYDLPADARIITSTSKAGAISSNIADPTPTDAALGRLRSFKHWGANWDGEGAPAPDQKSLDHAIRLLSLLAQRTHSFGVDLDADGKPMFHLRGSAYEGFIVVEDDRTISFSFRKGANVVDDYEVGFDGRRLPASLAEALNIV